MNIAKIELKHQAVEPLGSTFKWVLRITGEDGQVYAASGYVHETFGPAIAVSELPIVTTVEVGR